jgi:hypothetical protein
VSSETDIDKLRKIAAEGRWLDVREWLESATGQRRVDETPALFEEIGDRHSAAGAWGEALHCYHFGLEGAKRPRTRAAAQKDPLAALGALRLHSKWSNALVHISEEDAAFAKTLAQEIIALARQGLTKHAEELLGWLRGPKQYAVAGPEFEFAAGDLIDQQHDIGVWLYRKADQYYHAAGMNDFANRVHRRLDEILHPPPEPEELKQAREDEAKVQAIIPKLEALAYARKSVCCMVELRWTYQHLYPRISAHFEALGDQTLAKGDPEIARHMYTIAADTADRNRGRLLGKTLKRLRRIEIDQMIAHPIAGEPIPEPFNWDSALPYIQRLILAGRFSEGGALFARLKKQGDDYFDRFIDMSNTFVLIGDQVASTRPDSARWFYQKAYNEFDAFASSADTALEAQGRRATADEIKAKLDSLG